MGATGSVFFVDWAAVQEHCRAHPGVFWYDPAWDEAADGEWPARFRREPWRPDDWVQSWKCAFEADEYYGELRRDLSRSERALWDRFFATFFAMSRAPHAYDLPGFEPDEGIYNILGPASVARWDEEIGRADLERLRRPFEARCRPDPDPWLKDFDELASYLRQWFAAVGAAHRSGKALVLWAA